MRRFLASKGGTQQVTRAFDYIIVWSLCHVGAFAPRSSGCAFRPFCFNNGCNGSGSSWPGRWRAGYASRGTGNASRRTGHAAYGTHAPCCTSHAAHLRCAAADGCAAHRSSGASDGASLRCVAAHRCAPRRAHGGASAHGCASPGETSHRLAGCPAWRAALRNLPRCTTSYRGRAGRPTRRTICVSSFSPRRGACRARAEPAWLKRGEAERSARPRARTVQPASHDGRAATAERAWS